MTGQACRLLLCNPNPVQVHARRQLGLFRLRKMRLRGYLIALIVVLLLQLPERRL